jgi:gas vesicle protein
MGKYLRSTEGVFRNELRGDWEIDKVSQLLSHNNAAERPFAIAKAYLESFPTMKLSTLANFSLAVSNGSHRPAGTLGKTKKTKARLVAPAGIAISSPAILKSAVTKLCGVRKVRPGKVTAILRADNASKTLRADKLRKASQAEELERKARQHLKKGIAHNINMEEPLATSKDDVTQHLEMLGNAVGTSLAYLKRQFDAREARAATDKFTYPSIGPAFRAKDGRNLKKTPSNGEDKVEYIKNLLLKADSRRHVITDEDPTLKSLVRSNPVINLASTDPISIRAKQQQQIAVGLQVAQCDDPWLIDLEREYIGQLCFLNDISLRHKLYRICKIAYWPSTSTRYASWEATMEPVYLHEDGSLFMREEDVVRCSNGRLMTKARAYLVYILAEYIDGDEAEPTRSDCVDRYIMNSLQKHEAFVRKTRPANEASPLVRPVPHEQNSRVPE